MRCSRWPSHVLRLDDFLDDALHANLATEPAPERLRGDRLAEADEDGAAGPLAGATPAARRSALQGGKAAVDTQVLTSLSRSAVP